MGLANEEGSSPVHSLSLFERHTKPHLCMCVVLGIAVQWTASKINVMQSY